MTHQFERAEAIRWLVELGLKTKGEMTARQLITNPPWTSEKDDQLRRLAKNGESIATVAERLNRSEQAIRHRARKLGLTIRRVATEK